MADLAGAIAEIFHQQHHQAHRLDKERFGDWDERLRAAIEQGVVDLFLAAAPEGQEQKFAKLARVHARVVARGINDTTEKWILEGQDEDRIFGPERAAAIADTEQRFAAGASVANAAAVREERLRWHYHDTRACAFCRSIDGKVVLAGQPFGVFGGVAIYHPPAHPHCRCFVEVI